MTILKEAKYNAKWRQLIQENIPAPGDIVHCHWDLFRVINVIRRPDEESFGLRMHVADLEVIPIGKVEPAFLPKYEQGGFYVTR